VSAARLFVVADVAGPDDYHLGDEAMLEANLATLRRLAPGLCFTVPSRDPAWTGRRYDVDAIPAATLPADVLADPGRWEHELRAGAALLDPETRAELARCDGLVISGGGNLCSTWPEKVLERAALMAHAAAAAMPIVVVGQTVGPTLHGAERAALAAVLPHAGWVGVREAESQALATALGVPAERVHVQLDDAFFLAPEPVAGEHAAPLAAHPRRIVVTLDASFAAPVTDGALRALASQLDGLAELLDASLVFSPHVGGTRVPASHDDRVVGRKLAELVRRPLVLLDLWQPRAFRGLIAESMLVVSSRYHPLVFATAAGVPALGIHTDPYTRTKLRGALAWANLDGWCLVAEEAARGELLPLAAELWSRRDDVRARLAELHRDGWSREVERWRAIASVLRLEMPGACSAAPATAFSAPPRTSAPRPQLTDEQWRSYDERGYLRLGRVLDAADLAALQRRLDDIMLGRVRRPTLQMQLDTGGAYEDLPPAVSGATEATLAYRKVQGLETDPLGLALLRHPLFREVCARQYGPHASISIFRAMMMNKPAGQGTYLPWHQDGGDVWKLDRDPLVTIWVALDDATRENGCVQVIPGSHRLGLLSRHGSTLRPEDVEAHCRVDGVLHLEVAAGEALLLHNWLIHRSDVNPTPTPRRAFTACYMDGRTLGTLTGRRFPVVFGEPEDPEVALAFLGAVREENRQLHAMRREAERYAKSLEAELRRIRSAVHEPRDVPRPSRRRWWPLGR
jgi:polysaccharide pyruvyl transferase WcaK-like protein